MKRQVTLEEISDGRLYEHNDMAKIDCGGCIGCHACCENMGSSVILDPYDVMQLTQNLKCSLEALIQNKKIALNVVDGVILPNLAMDENGGKCGFLSDQGRCLIHSFRPGICRLFPLGRYYENHNFKYFIQVHECRYKNRGKMKIHKWLGVPDLKVYEKFVTDWHYFLNDVEAKIRSAANNTVAKQLNLYILQTFYLTPYDKCEMADFYSQFEERLETARGILEKL